MRERERERGRFYFNSPIDAPKTMVLIAIRSINIHQHDSSYLLVPHVPSSLASGRTHVYSGEGENIGTRRGVVELLELVVILLF